jgi:hypothetical protein
MTNELFAARIALVDAREICSRGAFPGSKAAKAETAAMMALGAFDRANPGVKKAWFAIDEMTREEMACDFLAAARAK